MTTGWSSDRLLLAPFPTTGCNEQDVQIKKKNVHRNVALSCTVIGQKLSHNQLNQSNAKLDLLRAFSTAVGSFRCCFCCRFFFFKVLRAPSDNLQHWMTPPDFRC